MGFAPVVACVFPQQPEYGPACGFLLTCEPSHDVLNSLQKIRKEEKMGPSISQFRFIFVLLLLAFSATAHAALVIKPLNQTITRPAADPPQFTGGVNLDLNDDSIPDVSIVHQTFAETGLALPHSQNVIGGINGATILGDGSKVAALKPGQLVDPAGNYLSGVVTIIDSYNAGFGNPLFTQPDVAIGVRIPVGGQNYYAWLGVQLAGAIAENPNSDRLLLHDYGYQTTPNTAAIAQAPEPAGLALIALATVPLLIRRRRDVFDRGIV
jgi:hypothetical protein